jgi:hypothetical protein
MKWVPQREDGDQTPIQVQKFKHWIGTQEHWFCVHGSLEYLGQYTVSDWDSGFLVKDIDHMTLAACRGNVKDAARLTLKKLVERVGESRVLEVLRNAQKRK